MSQVIKIQLLKQLAINSAKNETFQKGLIDRAEDAKNVTKAFHESAGDDEYHERMLARAFLTQCEMLKTWFSEYLTGSGNSIEDPLVSSEESNEAVDILLKVSDRFNLGYVKTLARLGQKYVEDRMVHLWWATSDEKKSEFYATLAEQDLVAITQCFNKTAPQTPSYNFPDTINLTFPILDRRATVPGGSSPGNTTVPGGSSPGNTTVPGGSSPGNIVPVDTLMSYPYIIAVGEETEITYVLTCNSGKKPVDDIIVRADDGCCMPCLDKLGKWQVRGIKPGMSVITLQSRHDDTVFARFALRVTE